MSGAIPQLPQYAFMAWCSVETQGQLYLLPTAQKNEWAPKLIWKWCRKEVPDLVYNRN
jgi:hypothetical protein